MANDFNASLVISTSEAVTNVRAVDAAAKDLDKTLAHLHTTMQAGQKDLDALAGSLKVFKDTQRQANKDQKDRNATLISEQKLEREQIINKGKVAEQTNKQAIAEAKLQGVRARNGRGAASGLGNETRRNAESANRIAQSGVLTTARAVTEAERLAAAEHRTAAALATRSAATDRAQMSAMRLAAAQQRANNSSLALNDSLSNSRYLLYDVGATYATLSAVLLAIPTATTMVAASYEKDFTNVIRTTGVVNGEVGSLYDQLKQLGREIPLSFGEFANIASIAGQLGIAKDEIGAFTETVAKFGAASNVSIDQAATAFGRFENSFNADGAIPDFYNRVGSAIAKVGVESAASETEIIAVSNQISAAGAQFGFTADQIVGLSGALASVRIRPELARGAFQRILLTLSRAADAGAESFNQFGKYTGLAADQSLALFKADPSAFFQKYIAGLKGTVDAGTSVSAVMDDIGAKNVFDKQFILGLVNGLDVYNKAMSDSAGAFEEGSFLSESTKATFETFAATLVKLGTAFSNLGATLGGGSLSPLTDFAENITDVINGMERMIDKAPGIGVVINALLSIGGVIGVFLAFKSAQAFVLAGLVGLQQVMGKTSIAGAMSLRGNMAELAKTMLMSKGATAEAAQAFLAANGTMKAMGMSATATRAQVTALNTTLTGTSTVVTNAGAAAGGSAGRFRAFGSAAMGLVGGPIGALVLALGAVAMGFMAAEEKANQAGDAIARAMKSGGDAGIRAISEQLTDRTVDSFITDLGSGGIGNHGKNIRELADTVGISFDKIVSSVAAGTEAGNEFQKVMDEFAVGKGFKDFNDLAANSSNLQNYKGEIQFLQRVVGELGAKSEKAKADIDGTDAVVEKLGASANQAAPSVDGLTVGMEDVADAAQEARDAIEEAVSAIFGIVNAEAATQGSLGKLGAGLQETLNFDTNNEGGRTNLSNFEDTLRNAALQQQHMIETGEITMQQAAANYTAFIDGLMAELVAKGVDPAQIQGLANGVKGIFGTTFASGTPVTMPVKAPEPQQIVATAGDVRNTIQAVLDNQPAQATIWADASQADAQMQGLAKSLAEISGIPYTVVLDALTNPANEKSKQVYDLLTSITNGTYVAPVNADTSAAITNVQNFLAYARTELAHLQSELNGNVGYGDGEGSLGTAQKAQYDALGAPQMVSTPAAAAPVISTPQIQTAPTIPTPNFDGLTNGYNDAAKAAENAGEKAKKMGEDAANGIDEATNAATDYGNRLRQGLQSVFDKQHGVQSALDAYNTTLNSINKKREDEKQQLQDLLSKQKELNNARKEDLVTARKAGIEKAISTKYGEVDRAADYASQEQTALDNAAAKQKDIDATKKQAAELQAGIGNYKGNSQAAIDNRSALRDLESKMLDVIGAYASSGLSIDEVKAKTKALTAQFKTDVTQLGVNKGTVDKLKLSVQYYRDMVNTVPRTKPTTVSANTGAAKSAIDGIKSAINSIPNNSTKRITVEKTTKSWYMGSVVPTPNRTKAGDPIYRVVRPDGTNTNNLLFNKGGQIPKFNNGGLIPGRPPTDPSKDNLFAQVDGKGQVMVRSGEFIVQQPAVDYWGLDFFKRLNDMKMPAFNAGGSVGGGRSGGAGASGPVLVELTAENIAAIQRMPAITLVTENAVIARSANEGNAILATQGAN